MKSLMFIIALLSIACAVECRDIDREAVKQLFKDDVRDLIDGTQEDTNDRFLSDRALAPLQDDNSDICDCKDKCPKPELPAHLLNESNFFKHENHPIDCRKGSRVYSKDDKKFLCEDLYDCCRLCNAAFFMCLEKNGAKEKLGVHEQCLRESYECMCKCLEHNKIEEIP